MTEIEWVAIGAIALILIVGGILVALRLAADVKKSPSGTHQKSDSTKKSSPDGHGHGHGSNSKGLLSQLASWGFFMLSASVLMLVAWILFFAKDPIKEARAQAEAEIVHRQYRQSLLCGRVNPVPYPTELPVAGYTGKPEDWEKATEVRMPPCRTAEIRVSDDSPPRVFQCKRGGRWPKSGLPSKRSECNGVTAVRYLSATGEPAILEYWFSNLADE